MKLYFILAMAFKRPGASKDGHTGDGLLHGAFKYSKRFFTSLYSPTYLDKASVIKANYMGKDGGENLTDGPRSRELIIYLLRRNQPWYLPFRLPVKKH
jgi:hypothetical protein